MHKIFQEICTRACCIFGWLHNQSATDSGYIFTMCCKSASLAMAHTCDWPNTSEVTSLIWENINLDPTLTKYDRVWTVFIEWWSHNAPRSIGRSTVYSKPIQGNNKETTKALHYSCYYPYKRPFMRILCSCHDAIVQILLCDVCVDVSE